MEAAPLLETLGQRARELRQQQSLTLRSLAERSGLSLRFLMDVEAGRGNISVRRLADLASALSTTPADLLTPRSAPARVLALLGLRGAGKTTVGKQLARKLRLPFVELDRQIERRAGLAVGEIFSLHGEDYYRRLERETLAALLTEGRPMVLAAGGGIVTAEDTYALLRRHATTVWLKAELDEYWNRLLKEGDLRPMADQPQARDALRALIARREPLYGLADVTVDTTGLTIKRTVDQVMKATARPRNVGAGT